MSSRSRSLAPVGSASGRPVGGDGDGVKALRSGNRCVTGRGVTYLYFPSSLVADSESNSNRKGFVKNGSGMLKMRNRKGMPNITYPRVWWWTRESILVEISVV